MIPSAQSILKSIVLFISWLFFSPVFLILSIKWKMPKKIWRIVLTIIAPFTILALIGIIIFANFYYYHFIKRGSRNEIETLTRIELPKYKIIERRHLTYGPRLQGDFTMEYKIKLDTLNIKEFYKEIENQIIKNKQDSIFEPYWTHTDSGDYYFSSSGVQPETQESLSLTVDKKNSTVDVKYGSW